MTLQVFTSKKQRADAREGADGRVIYKSIVLHIASPHSGIWVLWRIKRLQAGRLACIRL